MVVGLLQTNPMTDEEPTPKNTTPTIQIEFPDGEHTTRLGLAIAHCDAAQLELAGHFLLRQADKFYRQARIRSRLQSHLRDLG